MLSIFANAMNIATRTHHDPDKIAKNYRALQESKKFSRETYKRWAEVEGRYLR